MKDELIDQLNQKTEQRTRLMAIPGFSLVAHNFWATLSITPSHIRKWSTRLMHA